MEALDDSQGEKGCDVGSTLKVYCSPFSRSMNQLSPVKNLSFFNFLKSKLNNSKKRSYEVM